MSLRTKRLLYANLLNLEYLLGLAVAYLLGSEQWLLFTICLVLTLTLGCITTAFYWAIQDETVRNNTHAKTN